MPDNLCLFINYAFRKYLINTPLRQAHFFAQMLVETGLLTLATENGEERHFRTMYEKLTPQEAADDYDHRQSLLQRIGALKGRSRDQYIAQRPAEVATKAKELGNTQPGDGTRFRGRGLLQITGRNFYQRYADYRKRPYTTDPNPAILASNAFAATDVSGWYWVQKVWRHQHINQLASHGTSEEDQKQVTRSINGGLVAWPDRHAFFEYVWSLLCDAPNPPDTDKHKRQIKE